MSGVEIMNCEEYIVEINKMLDVALKRGDRSIMAFIYKLLCKYVKAT